MSRVLLALGVMLVLLLAGCQLHTSTHACTNDPGLTGGGTTVCEQPPPSQFTQLGQ
jgi:hypothetical protein